MKKILPWLKTDGLCLLVLLALVLFFFAAAIFSSAPGVLSSFVSPDLSCQFFPWRHFGFQNLKAGTMPLWNPYVFGGIPFLAEIQTSIFYPLNLIFLLFRTHVALNLSVILHVFLAGAFTFYFLRSLAINRIPSLLAAVAFMFSAPVVFHVYPGHVSNLCTLAWIPLVFLVLESLLRRRKTILALALGGVIALQVFAGHAQYVFYTVVAAGAYFLFRLAGDRDCRRHWQRLTGQFLLALVLAAALSAVQLLVSAEALRLSMREDLSFEFVSIFSFPPENLVTLLFPTFFGDLIHIPYWGRYYLWEMCAYLGIVPLVLAVIAASRERDQRTFAFGILAAAMLVLALGRFTPALKLLYRFVPGFNLFRGNSKFICLFAFSAAVLAGIGCQYLIRLAGSRERERLRGPGVVCAVLASLVVLLIGVVVLSGGGEGSLWSRFLGWDAALDDRGYNQPLDPGDPQVLQRSFSQAVRGGIMGAFLLASLSALFFLTGRKRIDPKNFGRWLVLLTAVDLFLFGARYVVLQPLSHCFWDEGLVSFLKADPEIFRVDVVNFSFPGINQGMNDRLATAGGYGANVLRRYNEFFNLSQGKSPDQPSLIMTVSRISGIAGLLNVKYLISPAEYDIDHAQLELVSSGPEVKIYRNKNCLPRTFLVHQTKLIRERDGRLAELSLPEFDPLRVALIEEEGAPPLSGEVPAGEDPPRITGYDLNRVTVEAGPKADAFLVLGDVYYPGWKVFVDGKAEKLYCADHAFRGVFLPSGRHRVEFVYVPSSFRWGAGISLFALAAGSAAAVFFRRREKKAPKK